jgi:hypothetical protein
MSEGSVDVGVLLQWCMTAMQSATVSRDKLLTQPREDGDAGPAIKTATPEHSRCHGFALGEQCWQAKCSANLHCCCLPAAGSCCQLIRLVQHT